MNLVQEKTRSVTIKSRKSSSFKLFKKKKKSSSLYNPPSSQVLPTRDQAATTSMNTRIEDESSDFDDCFEDDEAHGSPTISTSTIPEHVYETLPGCKTNRPTPLKIDNSSPAVHNDIVSPVFINSPDQIYSKTFEEIKLPKLNSLKTAENRKSLHKNSFSSFYACEKEKDNEKLDNNYGPWFHGEHLKMDIKHIDSIEQKLKVFVQ